MPMTRASIGVGDFTDGKEYYEALLRWHLSVNMTAKEIHELGLQEVERIELRMMQVCIHRSLLYLLTFKYDND